MFSVVLNVILGLVRRNIDMDSILPVAGIMLGLVLVINAIILPLIYKFGRGKEPAIDDCGLRPAGGFNYFGVKFRFFFSPPCFP